MAGEGFRNGLLFLGPWLWGFLFWVLDLGRLNLEAGF